MHDLIFRNARIVDGTGSRPLQGDVAVDSDRIAAVGELTGAKARRVFDVDGLVLSPGFIDLHTHSDFTLPVYPRAPAMVRQGVTTQLVGNCGFSPFPVQRDRLDMLRAFVAFFDAGLSWEWTDAAGYAAHLDSLPLACNAALQVGHGAVRTAVMGFDNRPPTASELSRMERLVSAAFEEGAVALSTGLIYVPGSYAQTDELMALAEVAARYGGFYSTHIRGEGDTLLAAVEEALAIGRAAAVPVQLSHHKAMGRRNWGRVEASLMLIDRAIADGMDVLADQYPYPAGSTTLAATLPPWALEGGVEAMRRRLADATLRARVRKEMVGTPTEQGSAVSLSAPRIGTGEQRDFDPETIMISAVPEGPDKRYEGKMLTEIAASRGIDAVEVALDLLQEEGGGVQMIIFGMSEDDVRRVMRHSAVAVASDGWTLDPAAGGKPHPRSYGTYARVLGHYVREEGVLTLEEAVRKMTSLPARRLRRPDLGLVSPGCIADLVLFDPGEIADLATFDDPHRFCAGVTHVVVNGRLVIEHGHDTGASAGRVLRRTDYQV